MIVHHLEVASLKFYGSLGGPSMAELMHFAPPIYGHADSSYRDYLIPGFMVAMVSTLALMRTAVTLVVDRKGPAERAATLGVRPWHPIVAQVMLQLFALIVQSTLMIMVVAFGYGVDVLGNIALVGLLVVLQGLVGMAVGKWDITSHLRSPIALYCDLSCCPPCLHRLSRLKAF